MQNIKKISKRIEMEIQSEYRKRKRATVKKMMIDVLLGVTGWSGLEPWAEDAIDRLLDGRPVDIAQLRADLLSWQQQQENQPPEGENNV